MRNNWYKKGLVAGIIVLLIGVTIASGISFKVDSSKTMQTDVSNNELVKIPISICRVDSVEDYEVSLTQQQVEDLDNLIDNIKPELDKVETRVETVRLFRDIIISLDKLGMLPEDMSVLEALRLVTGNLYFLNPRNIFNLKPETYIDKGNTQPQNAGLYNEFCYLYAKASYCDCWLTPCLIFGKYCFDIPDFNYYYFPSQGWVWTNGNKGIQYIEGKIKGDTGFEVYAWTEQPNWYCDGYVGALPFMGIYLGWKWNFWFGYAWVVKIAYW